MSIITSPRSPSLGSTPTSSRTASPAPQVRTRANKAALRDYYGLKASTSGETASPKPSQVPEEPSDVKHSELDDPDFDAEAYVRSVLAGNGLEGVLKIESGLIGEIKSLDGEKKALVYDNYSKLITATDTIRSMRDNMGPLTPATSTLSPAIAHIAETAKKLAMKPPERPEQDSQVEGGEEEAEREKKRRQRETVRWVVGAPKRLGTLIEGGKKDEAENDWREIKELLRKWQGVDGVEEVKEECEKVMGRS